MQRLKCLTVMCALLVLTGTTRADMYQFNVTLDGLQEVPPVATPGFGAATAIFDDVTGQMSISGTFQDLIGTTTNSHLHGYAPFGTSAGVVFGLSFTPGATSGTISGAGIIPAARIADTLNGLTYINIHSSFKAGGEIRGQLTDPVLIPEPTSLALLAIGGVVTLRRRRQAR